MAARGATMMRSLPKGWTTSGRKQPEIDTKEFDTAVAMILKWWKPPPDMKRVIASELGAILALTSNDTKMAGKSKTLGGSRKMSNTFRQAFRAIKIKYEPWKKHVGGRPPKGSKGSLQTFKVGGKKYYRKAGRSRYSDGTWAMINAALTRPRRKALLAAGSSRGGWMRMLFLAYKQAGFEPKIPASWKESDRVRRVSKYMDGSSSRWSRATKAEKEANEAAGNFVLKVQSTAHNTLNYGVGGMAAFRRRMKGRQPYVAKAFTKKMKLTMKQQLKKFPGMDVVD